MKRVLPVVFILGLCVLKTFAQCPFTLNTGNDTTICANRSAYLNCTVTPAGTYTYQWSPAGTLNNANIANPAASPSDTTTYTVSVTGGGCTAVDSVHVNVSGAALVIQATVLPTTPICPGQLVQLDANIVPTICGITPACAGSNTSPTVGSGTTTQPGNGYVAPTIFGNLNKSGRNQMLYTAAELTTALGGACTLKGIAFDVATFNSNAYLLNFTISISCTNQTSLSAFDNNLVQVLAPATIQPSAGWNSFALTNAYNWDGVSNLIVDVCWWDPVTYGNQNNKAQCTTTAFNSFLYAFSDAGDICGTVVAPNVSTLRPNIRFGFCQPNISNYNIVWTPSAGANTVSSPGIHNPTSNPLTSQDYTIAVGSGQCIGYKTVSVTVDTSRVSAGPDISSCPGSAVNLNATIIGSVIPGPASFNWTTLSGTAVGNTQSVTVHPVVNTTYVVAMSGGACTHYDTVNVTLGSLNVVANPVNVKCNGQTNGKIVVVASNGTLPYTYTWSANAATANIDSAVNLGTGVFTVTVSDINTCSGTATATITQPLALQNSSILTTPIKCFGGNNGLISVTPSGGTTPYTYGWSGGLPANSSQSGLIAANYTVTTTDANGCTAVSTIPLTQPTQLTFAAAVVQNEKCAGSSTGKITVSPTGGVGNYTYTWSQNAGLNSATAQNLAAGAYTVTVKDGNQCTASSTNTITAPAPITFNPSVTDSTKCFGSSDGSATVNPTGGTTPYAYVWTPSNQLTQTATGLSAQTYTVGIVDDSLCAASTTVTIGQPGQMLITGQSSNISCNGSNDGAAAVTAVTNAHNPVTYSWSNFATTQGIINLSPNTYYVTVTDANGCVRSDTFVVTQPPLLVLNAPAQVNDLCLGYAHGSLTANATGGTGAYGYVWSNAATTQTISNLLAGPYTVTVSDLHLCTATATYTITEPATGPVFGNAVITNVLCHGNSTGSILVSVSGGTPGYTYSWSQNQQLNDSLAGSLAAGTYTVTATDANGCSVSGSNPVTEPTAVAVGNVQVINDSCHGGSNGTITVNPSGGTGAPYTYTFNGTAGANPETGLTANTYIVVVTDGNSCTASASVPVNQPAPIQDSITRQNVLCRGGSDGMLTAYAYGGNPPFTYAWSNGTNNQVDPQLPALAVPYTVTITDNTGCTVSDAASVSEPATLPGFTHSETQVKCPGDQNGTITAYPAGGTPPYNFSVTKDETNFISAANLTAYGLDSGLYHITLADHNGCTITDTAFVKSPVKDFFAVTVDSTSCFGADYADGSITVIPLVANNMPFTYTIDGSSVQDTNYFGNLAVGRHQIIATNQFGCPTTLDTTVSQPVQGFTTVLPKDTTLQLGQALVLASGFGPFDPGSITSYNWVPSEGLSCIDCPNPVVTPYSHLSEYKLTITYNGHCTASDSMEIIVQNNVKFFIPNSFSPNGDGINDVFEIYGEAIKTVKMRIFNRWGELIFESTNQFKGWDGTFKGNFQIPGVYTYDAEITFLDDTKAQKHGSVTLIR